MTKRRTANKRSQTSTVFIAASVVALVMLAGCGRSKHGAQSAQAKPAPTVSSVPQLTPPPGIYDAVTSVTLSSVDAGAKIFYTTDGSDPIVDRSAVYAGPINIADKQVVRAVAKAANLPASEVTGGGYSAAAKGALDLALYADVVADDSNSTAEQIADGVFGDPGNGWVAGGVDSWIKVKFDVPTAVSRLLVADSAGTDGHVTSAKVIFSDGSELTADSLADDGAPSEIEFPVKTVSWLKLIVKSATGMNFGIAELAAFPPAADQKLVAVEQFAGMPWGWNLAAKRADAPSGWEVVDKREEKGLLNGATFDGYEVGMYGLWTGPVAKDGLDLRVRARDDNMNVSAILGTGMIGVIFGYQDDNNFYRYSVSMHRGFRKLEKRVNGVFTELARSSRSFNGGQWVNLRIVMRDGKLIALQDGDVVLAAEDSSFASGKVGVWSGWSESATFDKVVMMTAPIAPMLALTAPVAYSVTTQLDLNVRATVTMPVPAVEFVVDEGQSNEQRARIKAPPYQSAFHFSAPGDHVVSAYIVDEAGTLDESSRVRATKVGVGGMSLMTFGDSITDRVGDDWILDDISRDGRSTGGGYETYLSDLLSSHIKTRPVVVANEGYAGEMTFAAVEKIPAVVKHHPEASAVLLQIGTNDSSGDQALGDEEFAKRVAQMVDSVLAAGKEVYVAKPPPRLRKDKQNELLRKYNQRIEALVTAYEKTHPGKVHLGPDFYRYFDSHHEEFYADGIHPNGIGLRSMARLWFDVLKERLN